jgi:Predicted transcriptional regulators
LENIGLIYSKKTVGKFITTDTKVIKNMQINLAKNEIKEFFLIMTNIGFANKEIIDIILTSNKMWLWKR